MKWKVVYERSIQDDGSLFFPERLSHEFLESARRTMGSYLFANQYQNEIIPAELQSFKQDWFKYYDVKPKTLNTFIHVDPAISLADTADFTGVVVVQVDPEKEWYVPFARRYKVTPTELIDLIFRLSEVWSPMAIGIEEIAYQKALLYFLDEEMRRRNRVIPIKGVKPPNNKSKEARILSLVPRFEFGHIHMARGLHDLEMELLQFPRGAHDDLIDSLASIDYIAFAPTKEDRWAKKPGPSHPDYEAWFLDQLRKGQDGKDEDGDEDAIRT